MDPLEIKCSEYTGVKKQNKQQLKAPWSFQSLFFSESVKYKKEKVKLTILSQIVTIEIKKLLNTSK